MTNTFDSMTADRPSLSIVVAVFRGESLLAELIRRVDATLSSSGIEWELIMVNDSDRTEAWAEIRNQVEKDHRLVGINLTRNYGQHAATLAGMRAARGELTLTMDEDLEQPPESIPLLLAAMTEEVDVVYGSPPKRWQPATRRFFSWVTRTALRYLFGLRVAFYATSFRLFRTELRSGFRDLTSFSVSIDALLTLTTRRFTFVTVKFEEPGISGSGYTFIALLSYAFDLITGFSTVPLRAASLLGFFFTFFGLCTLGWVVGRYMIEGGNVPGFPFLASIIAIFSGAQLFALGIIGEYIARIHFRMMALPPYVTKEVYPGETGRREGRQEAVLGRRPAFERERE